MKVTSMISTCFGPHPSKAHRVGLLHGLLHGLHEDCANVPMSQWGIDIYIYFSASMHKVSLHVLEVVVLGKLLPVLIGQSCPDPIMSSVMVGCKRYIHGQFQLSRL